MSFQFCDSMIQQYRTEGYAVFRQILPPSLISDLRKACARVPELAREKSGPQAQRLQPIASYDIDLKPFKDYAELPDLVDAIARILTPRHRIGTEFNRTGILIEPAERPGWTTWHRDITEESNVPDVEEFRRIDGDPLWFNQINCPLYEDNCTWYVPGSHLRENFTEEVEAANAPRPPEDTSYEELERAGVQYAQSMPRAVRLSMDAGDFALYHPNAWHIGNYLPDRKRITIHDFAPSPELLDWYRRWNEKRASAKE
ncbi:MAG: phytanoyl-CoA dioxygenase family protein [Planctomycetota bacterium]|nr:phytanoyl-CoA dioxygenase family protein [Planctomycetota bacterium]MDP7135391.1 phytanoyl-CoA dioxygenase family protein [Planctomycetota bacterium]MDP7250424.1 phytanoyl-CoA dioxygenase family protein [Planctomycetota bacterium]